MQTKHSRVLGVLYLGVVGCVLLIFIALLFSLPSDMSAQEEKNLTGLGVYIVFPDGWTPVASWSMWGWVCVNGEGIYRECEPQEAPAP